MELKLSIKQILLDILSVKNQISEYYKDNPKYETLFKFLNAKDYYHDEELPIPTLKEIGEQTGIKSHQLRKLLTEIYQDFFNYPWKHLKFPKTKVYFNLKYFKRYAMFLTEDLSHIPRIGEHVTVPFLKAKTGTDRYYVKDIRHDFSGDTHTIDIDLKGGKYNKFYQLRLDEYLATGRIGPGALFDKYDWEIREMLGLRRH